MLHKFFVFNRAWRVMPNSWGSFRHQSPIQCYLQNGHVRQYGGDFRNRLCNAGFSLLVVDKDELLTSMKLERLSVSCEKSGIIVKKPLHNIGTYAELG